MTRQERGALEELLPLADLAALEAGATEASLAIANGLRKLLGRLPLQQLPLAAGQDQRPSVAAAAAL